ncbi:MAG: AAA family ATPase [Ignavibacteria bacterium]|nr:AAA family ATPase [Ignavibacteria bacterium]
MKKDNFYVITGGPGGGKTTLLEYLQAKGIPYVPEVARALISERLRLNLPPRPEPFEFALQLFERDLGNFLRHSEESAVRFFDRSFIDSAGMLKSHFRSQKDLDHVLKEYRYNARVFITPPWKEIYCNDDERDQTFDDAVRVYNELHHWYSVNGYELVVLPQDTAEARAEFVMNIIFA